MPVLMRNAGDRSDRSAWLTPWIGVALVVVTAIYYIYKRWSPRSDGALGGVHSKAMTTQYWESVRTSDPDLAKRMQDVTVRVEDITREVSKAQGLGSKATANLRMCIEQIRNAAVAKQKIEQVRSTPYDSTNSEHEKLLERLWRALKPGVERKARKTDEWTEIGFQGQDPATDFRGGGVLGLINLVHYAESYPDEARRVMQESCDEERLSTRKWYMFAVSGINFTGLILKQAMQGKLDSSFYEARVVPGEPNYDTDPAIEAFDRLYVAMFRKFHSLWLEEQPSVMEFNSFVAKRVLPDFPKDVNTQ